MKLIRHYSNREVRLADLDFSRYDEPRGYRDYIKPSGFWVSIDDNDDGWADWCKGEEFRLDSLTHVHEVRLKNTDRIKLITSVEEIRLFAAEFEWNDKNDDDLMRTLMCKQIDWARVKAAYSGIIIAPYLYQVRLDRDLFWYYAWDCASGSLWSPDVIDSIRLIEVKPEKAAA